MPRRVNTEGGPTGEIMSGHSLNPTSLRWWLLIILLVAAILRIYGLNNVSPPGLEHDEVANWLIDRSILAGNHAIYFTDAYGHEAGFHYLQAVFVGLLGDHALSLRLPAAFAGLLLVSVNFVLTRQLFGKKTALFAAALLATLFWPVFYSRLGLRAISLPLVSGISAYFWWEGWNVKQSSPAQTKNFLLAGLFAGASIHTYMAARAVPIFYSLLVIYLALFHWSKLKRRWRVIFIFWLVYAVIAAPLLIYIQTNPGSEFRITEIDAPLRALLAGNLRPVFQNVIKIIGMFGLFGDPLWRQNIAGLPVFDPLIATLFYLSILVSLSRFKDIRYGFLLLWLLTSAIPSMVTIDAPSTIRIINSLPILTIFPFILIHNSGQSSTVIHKLSTKTAIFRMQSGLTFLILYTIVLTSRSLFWVWPANDEVQFVWQAALREAASYLDASLDSGPVAVGGWTPSTMDPPTMHLALRRDDLRLSYFDPTSTLIIPVASPIETIRILHPSILELNPLFVDKLAEWGATTQTINNFTLYTLPDTPAFQPQVQDGSLFGDEILFLGYNTLTTEIKSLEMITYWQIDKLPDGPRRLFVHLVDGDGTLLVEDYSFDQADTRSNSHWQPGDIILQHLTINLETTATPKSIQLRLGIFDPNSCPPFPCKNLETAGGASFIQFALRE